jgi:hypothetical protein
LWVLKGFERVLKDFEGFEKKKNTYTPDMK